MSLKKVLLFMFLLACIVTTIHLLWISGVHLFMYTTTDVRLRTPMYRLFRWPLHGFLSVLPILIFIKSDDATKLGWSIRVVIHFFLTIIFTLGSWILLWYQWHDWGHLFRNIAAGYYTAFLLIFTAIYVSAYLAFTYYQRGLANKFNEKIHQRKLQRLTIDETSDIDEISNDNSCEM